VLTSSLAVFGAVDKVDDKTAATPQSSYGCQKAIGELLVNDYSRRGFIDGRTLRLPTISIRPGKPNTAASGFASSILREPLAGMPTNCPVDPSLEMWIASPATATSSILHGYELPQADLGQWTALNTPGITVTVAQMIAALRAAGGDDGLVSWKRDPAVEAIVGSWPARFDAARASELGFAPADDLDTLVRQHVQEHLS